MARAGRLSRYRRAAGGGSRAHYYASRRGALAEESSRRGFISLIVLLPLATFVAVFMWNGLPPAFAMGWNDPKAKDAELRALEHASETDLVRKRWPTTAAMLDGAQPDLSWHARELARPTPSAADAEGASYPVCSDAVGTNCVIEGDTSGTAAKRSASPTSTHIADNQRCAQEASILKGQRASPC